MSPATTGYANINGGKLYYEIGGEGHPLVLVHAGPTDSRIWDDQWDEFTRHYRVIRFDMRGYGKSDLATGPVSRRDDLYQLLKHLKIERAHVLGCSMGGEIVIDLTVEHPEMVSALIAVSASPGGFELQGEPPRYLMEMMEAVQKGDVPRAAELQNRIWVDGPFREPDQVDQRIRQRVTEMNTIPLTNSTFGIADSQPLNPLDPPAAGRLSEIHVPTLIIIGALDDPEILRAGDVMNSQIKGARTVVIPDTAHLPSIEQPALFNRAVLNFLATVK